MRTRYALSAPTDTGREALQRLGLRTEAKLDLNAADLDGLGRLVHTAHAPFSLSGRRLNVACTDDAWRQHSIDLQRDYILACERFPDVTKVVCHLAPRIWYGKSGDIEQTGEYDLLVSSLRDISDLAATRGLVLVLENNRTYYRHHLPHAPATPEGVSAAQYFGAMPDEWLQIVRDVGRDHCLGCLDTSHASTTTHRGPLRQRSRVIMEFLSQPDLIGHVHWNGNTLDDAQGRDDLHWAIHKPGLPLELHRAIAGLDATLHLEHFFDVATLEQELAFVAAL